MGGKVRRLDFYPDEYVSGVGGVLTAVEQGVFWMVCTLIMSEGQAIKYDDRRLAGLLRMRPADLRKVVGTLLDVGKLTLSDDGKLSQKRAQNEVKRAANRIQSAQENGSKGGRPAGKGEQNQQPDKPPGSSGEKLTNNYQPATSIPSKDGTPSDQDWLFDGGLEILTAGGSTEKQARGLIGKWRKDGFTDRAIRAALVEAQTNGAAEPNAYVTRILRRPPKRDPTELGTHADSDTTRWRARMRGWNEDGSWSTQFGPPPDDPRTQVPKHILEEAR